MQELQVKEEIKLWIFNSGFINIVYWRRIPLTFPQAHSGLREVNVDSQDTSNTFQIYILFTKEETEVPETWLIQSPTASPSGVNSDGHDLGNPVAFKCPGEQTYLEICLFIKTHLFPIF